MDTTKIIQCRCCLVSIDDNVPSNEGYINLDMYINIKDNLNVFLSKDPRLSQTVCPSCNTFINEVKSFRKMVMESEKYLFQITDCGPEFKVNVKQELLDAEDNNSNNYGISSFYVNCAIKDDVSSKSTGDERLQGDEDEMSLISLKKSKYKKTRMASAKVTKKPVRRKKETDTNQGNGTYQGVMNFCGNRAMKAEPSSRGAGDESSPSDDEEDDQGDGVFKLEDKEDVPLITLKKSKYERTIKITTNVDKKPVRPKKEVEGNNGIVQCMHIKGSHLHEGIDYKHTGEKFFCCKCDNKTFKSLLTLKCHIKRIHLRSPKHICQICSKIFMTLAPYIRHRLEDHNIDERQKCNACDQVFNTRVQLRRHKNSFHMLGQKIKCDVCDYESFSAEALYKHKFKHRTVKDYHCSYCRKSFVRKTTLQLHERIHTGDRRKVCKICGQAFVQKASLNYHMTKYHPEVNF